MESVQSTTRQVKQSVRGGFESSRKRRMGVRWIGTAVSSLKTCVVSKIFRIYGNGLNKEEKREEGRKKDKRSVIKMDIVHSFNI